MKRTGLILLMCLLLVFAVSCNKTNENTEKETTTVQQTTENEPIPPIKEEIEETSEEKTISFLGCGDNIVYYGTWRDAEKLGKGGERKYNFKPMYSEVSSLIENADISFINQETLMCGDGYELSAYPCFNSPQDLGYDLCELGFDVVSMANNHMVDKGGAGLEKSIEFWKSMPVTMIGGYNDENDYHTPRIVEKDGIKIAFLAYTYSTNGLTASQKSNVYVPYLDDADIEKDVAIAKNAADLVFVSVHWGQEGQMKPNDYQIKYAEKFADAGVDVIIGHHPHVIQPVEWIYGKNGNKTLCVFSLGNFLNEQDCDYNFVEGMISFDIKAVGKNKPTVENPIFIPLVCHFDKTFYNNRIYLMENYTKELVNQHGITFYKKTTTLEKLQGYVSSTINDEYLPDSYKAVRIA